MADGANPIRIPGAPGALFGTTGLEEHPDWSPSGNRIAFVSDRDGGRDLFVMSSNGAGQLNLTIGMRTARSGANPTWSPDGQWIAFESQRVVEDTPGEPDGNDDIYKIHVASCEAWAACELDPDCDADPADCVEIRLTTDANRDSDPAWSSVLPDGSQWIAFAREAWEYGPSDIFIMRPDGSEQINLTNTPGEDEDHPAWSPDGRWIAFESGRAIYRLDVQQCTNASLALVEYREKWAHCLDEDPNNDTDSPACPPTDPLPTCERVLLTADGRSPHWRP